VLYNATQVVTHCNTRQERKLSKHFSYF